MIRHAMRVSFAIGEGKQVEASVHFDEWEEEANGEIRITRISFEGLHPSFLKAAQAAFEKERATVQEQMSEDIRDWREWMTTQR